MDVKFTATLLCSFVFVTSSLSCTTDANFELVKTWLINATSTMFNAFGRRAQFEVLEYSNKDPAYKSIPIAKSILFEIPFRLGDCESIRCMSSRIQNMKYLNSNTYTYYALRRVMEVEFPLSIHYPNSKKAIILLTDGAATDGSLLPRAFEKSVQERITNFAVGVGNYRVDQLQEFANGGVTNERVFTRTDFTALSSVIGALQDELEREGFFCDECSSKTDNCSVHARCINTPDSFLCECNEGYFGNGLTCEQFDYCANNPCGETRRSQCIIENNRPRCVCNSGFREEDEKCVDIDECVSSPCRHEHSECVNLNGTYICTCEEKYVWDGEKCSEQKTETIDIIAIITFILAILGIIAIIIFIVHNNRRQGSFSPRAPPSESESSEESVELHQTTKA